jgi:hypothetical protein
MGLALYVTSLLSFAPFHIASLFCIEYFDYDMPGDISFLVLSVWCSEILLNLNIPLFLKLGEIFSYYITQCVTDAFNL